MHVRGEGASVRERNRIFNVGEEYRRSHNSKTAHTEAAFKQLGTEPAFLAGGKVRLGKDRYIAQVQRS